MRGIIAASLAASALLLGGCDMWQNNVDDNGAVAPSEEVENFGGPIEAEDNMAGPAGGNASEDPAGNEAAANDSATPEQ